MKITHYDAFSRMQIGQQSKVVNFLHTHLGKYGDTKSAIKKSIEYALKERSGMGGRVILASEGEVIIGAVVLNKTGMEEYIPENILVYIATHSDYRGRGIGKKLMLESIEQTKGNIALHVEKDNPAKYMYEKLGFTNPYLEMRFSK